MLVSQLVFTRHCTQSVQLNTAVISFKNIRAYGGSGQKPHLVQVPVFHSGPPASGSTYDTCIQVLSSASVILRLPASTSVYAHTDIHMPLMAYNCDGLVL